MPFQLSPGVNVTEIDLTGIVPAVATSDGVIAGIFNWGPVGIRELIDTETKLVNIFGKPNSNNYETFFTASNFLSYSNRLYVTRAANTTDPLASNSTYTGGTWSAIGNTGTVTGGAVAHTIKNRDEYEHVSESFDPDVKFIAKYPGAIGNSLLVSVVQSQDSYSSVLQMDSNLSNSAPIADIKTRFEIDVSNTFATVTASGASAPDADTYANYLKGLISNGDMIAVGNSSLGTQFLSVANTSTVSGGVFTINFNDTYRLSANYVANTTQNATVTRYWAYHDVVQTPPVNSDYVSNMGMNSAVDTVSVVVIDENGMFTGVPGTVLETFNNLSRASDAKTVGGADNYYRTVINDSSNYIWIAGPLPAGEGTAATVTTSTIKAPLTISLKYGQDGVSESNAPVSILATGYDLYKSSEDVDISLVMQGKPTGIGSYQLANYLIDNIATIRKDCVAFVSPPQSSVTGANKGNEALGLVSWRNSLSDSSYAVVDSGYKYMYDRYNDVYRWVPMNGDIAGLCARTDNQRDPWWSPAGFNRGQIKNVLKLRWNPGKTDRDILYKNGINPVVAFPGQGTVLYGDKTLQSMPSAFDHINVRRLFIVLEKAISIASKAFLFEFNDEFTRSQFVSLINPYLRDVQARRGITDFLVVCDTSNNTPERIDRNEFWGDIYIKPARSINFIQLNFVAVRTGVQFSEIFGQF
jgi:hypothetical protein